MHQRLIRAFSCVKCDAAPDLQENIWRAVCVRNKSVARIKFFVFSLVGFASLAGLVPATRMLLSDFTQSGLYQYLSLIFSDGKTLTTYWREFAFTLAESLPILSILLSLALIFVFFVSIKYAMKQITRSGRLNNHSGTGQLTLSFKV